METPARDKPVADPIGCMIAQRITTALCGHLLSRMHDSALLAQGAPLADYGTIADIVYGEISDIADEQAVGDWIQAPNGSTWNLEFKPNK
jgi:hypothetical protein